MRAWPTPRPGGDELRPAPRTGEHEGLHVPLHQVREQRRGLAGRRASQRLLAMRLPVPGGVGVSVGVSVGGLGSSIVAVAFCTAIFMPQASSGFTVAPV